MLCRPGRRPLRRVSRRSRRSTSISQLWCRPRSRPQDVTDALASGGGDLLESVRLFDVYAGDQVAPGAKSLAFALVVRAPDRTLTAKEAIEVRDAALAEAASRMAAALR